VSEQVHPYTGPETDIATTGDRTQPDSTQGRGAACPHIGLVGLSNQNRVRSTADLAELRGTHRPA